MVDEAVVSSVNWLQVTVDQFKSGVSKVDLSMTRKCCDLYLHPTHHWKIKQESVVRSQTFPVPFVVLIWPFGCGVAWGSPYSVPIQPTCTWSTSSTACWRCSQGRIWSWDIWPASHTPLFGEKEWKAKQVRCENQITSVVDTCETWDTYIKLWPQPVPEDVVLECINVYYEGTQLKISPTCSVCAR